MLPNWLNPAGSKGARESFDPSVSQGSEQGGAGWETLKRGEWRLSGTSLHKWVLGVWGDLYWKNRLTGRAWVAQSVKGTILGLGSGCELRVLELSLTLGSVLNTESAEDSVPLTLPLSLSLK